LRPISWIGQGLGQTSIMIQERAKPARRWCDHGSSDAKHPLGRQ
jgi:hypothetical protein